MTDEEIIGELRGCDALLEGHFLLSSGRHSAHYLQCARVLMNPDRAGRMAFALSQKIPREIRSQIDVVVSPAMGGLIIGHEVGRALGKNAMFLERPEGTFELRRGFALEKGAKVLMVEDVVTTGISSREAIEAIAREGGEVIAEVALVDRSSGEADMGVPFFPLIQLSFPRDARASPLSELPRASLQPPTPKRPACRHGDIARTTILGRSTYLRRAISKEISPSAGAMEAYTSSRSALHHRRKNGRGPRSPSR